MPLASIVDPDYKIALFLHILAVVLAFGPTFGYALFFSVAPQYPRAVPAILAGVQRLDRYLVNPGMIILLLAGIVPAHRQRQRLGDQRRLRHRRLHRDHRPLRPPARLLPAPDPQGEGARGARPEGRRHAQPRIRRGRAGLGKVGSLAGLIVVVTIFFMTYKPFM